MLTRSLLAGLAGAMLLSPPALAGAQGLEQALAARQKALPKGKTSFQETFLVAPAGGAASEKDLKLAAKVAVFQEAPRERIEIRPVSGSSFGDAVVVVSNGKGYFLVTKLGSTPLAKSARAGDALVLQVLASPAGEAPKKRAVKSADGQLTAVVFREPRASDFSEATAFSLKAPKVGGGLLRQNLAAFGDSDDTTVTASAGARGVDEIDTPEGKKSVTPDPDAIVWLEGRDVGPLELEAFLLEGTLGPYAVETSR